MALFQRAVYRGSSLTVNGIFKRCIVIANDSVQYYLGNTKKSKVQCDFIEEFRGKPWVVLASPDQQSIVCSVSSDFEMHRGIAVQFKKKFGQIEELKEQNKGVGDVAVLKRNESNSFVYYLVVRERWWDLATKETFHGAITAMKNHCLENNVTQLSVPRLGTGDDGVSWDTVKSALKDVFHDSGVTIKAYTTR